MTQNVFNMIDLFDMNTKHADSWADINKSTWSTTWNCNLKIRKKDKNYVGVFYIWGKCWCVEQLYALSNMYTHTQKMSFMLVMGWVVDPECCQCAVQKMYWTKSIGNSPECSAGITLGKQWKLDEI